ncbi:Osmotically-inducible protein OsmY, contains BON domain [Noviherbaspirillum humi]|uniref:Osmotically-inducible protein OsmY, contains BON domain n=1 Tax=Noviherbaspirillum humi TaxID=1688639 RepID=A0A239CC25_9BURK|nr:BON domain-containing protein [Noviherbaspirillum humi]SNS17519.1 Osmotically-inducible protein OsmY, contains BON domain [Noviherbaspirillum humi]
MTRHTVLRPLAAIALCGALVTGLQGCIGLAVGTAVVGTLAASDRRTLGAQTEDKTITVKGEARVASLVGGAGHVNVTSYNRKVLLTGEVRDEQMKAAVEREVSAIEGVQAVVNELAAMPSSSFAARSNDTLITSKVTASFVDSKEIFANSFKVVTERGTVYLMGRVTQREGNIATDIARGIGGVQKVVKVFDYITEEELRQMTTVPQKRTSGSSDAEAAPRSPS